jgi:hypothetical protein
MPRLYKTIYLPLEKLNDSLRNSLNASNLGLRKTRTLVIAYLGGCHVPDQSKHLHHLLRALPTDGLEFLDLRIRQKEVSRATFELVHATQRCLRNVVSNLGDWVLEGRMWNHCVNLQNLTCLKVYIYPGPELERARYLVDHAPLLEELVIHAFKYLEAEHWSTLFESWTLSPTRRTKLRLRKLSFLDLRFDKDSVTMLAAAVNFSSLTHLEFSSCCETEAILDYAAQIGLNLQAYTNESVDCPGQASRDTHDGFLKSLRGLQALRLHVESYEDISLFDSWEPVLSQRITLRTLFIENCGYTMNAFDSSTGEHALEQLSQFCAGCYNLKQLAIESPSLLTDSPQYQADAYPAFLRCLRNLHALTTLRLFTNLSHPYLSAGGRDVELEQSLRERADEIASRAFGELHISCPQLRVVVVDVPSLPGHDDAGHDDDGVPPDRPRRAYMRAFRTDAFNRLSAVAQLVPLHMVKHHEPASNICYDYDDN